MKSSFIKSVLLSTLAFQALVRAPTKTGFNNAGFYKRHQQSQPGIANVGSC